MSKPAQSRSAFINQLPPEWVKAGVYGGSDGIITTFAVVAGVAGAGLEPSVILILGIANLIADGFSMGVGDYLGERAEQQTRQNRGSGEKRGNPLWWTGLVTFVAFVIAGSLPLLPYLGHWLGWWQIATENQLSWSVAGAGVALFLLGCGRSYVTHTRWWRGGVEVLSVGMIAAVVAYILGAVIEHWLLSGR